MKKFFAYFGAFLIALFAFTLIGSPAQAADNSVVLTGDGVLTVEGGWTEDTIEVGWTGPLSEVGPELDIQADPIQYVGLHIHTTLGTIVFEEEPSYNGQLWSNVAWPGVEAGLGYPALGTFEQFVAQNGAVEVTGITLLYTHPEASTTTVTSFTIVNTVFTFAPEVVEPEPTEEPVVPTEPAVVPPAVTPAPSAVGTEPVAEKKPMLAETGADLPTLLSLGAGFLIVGGLAFYLRRKMTVPTDD